MGLNPPFGVRASLANKFVKKALEFRPRILLLIVPEETERFLSFPSTSHFVYILFGGGDQNLTNFYFVP